MKPFLVIFFILLSLSALTQNKISGFVKDQDNKPLIGANIFIKGSYNGSTSDSQGYFELMVEKYDSAVLVISFLGYQTQYFNITNNSINNNLQFNLIPGNDKIEAVTINAGAFEAGEKKRAVLLNPIEIATTASSEGDIYAALATFPGVQKQGETGKIIVRGGDAYESKTFMDGMLVSSPYTSNMPDLPARGRFTPFMFNGVMFSTGGYSAEYGQALSSILELKTPGIFDENITSIGLMNVGANISHTLRNPRSAYSAEASYNNTLPYFLMGKHDLKWIKAPESFNGNFYHRIKIGKTGMIKTDITYARSNSKLNYSNILPEYNEIGLKNSNLFLKTGYNTELNNNWFLKSGYALNMNMDNKQLDTDHLKENLYSQHFKVGLKNFTSDNLTLHSGADLYFLQYKMKYFDNENNYVYSLPVEDFIASAFTEGDIKFNKKMALRLGIRGEYSTYTKTNDIAPRISWAYKAHKSGQVSLAWGKYYQQPHFKYLKYTAALKFEQAEHFILNYQIQKNKRILRSEIYYKKYKNLVTYYNGVNTEFENISNQGSGYAQGIDFFWKDSKTFKYATYWISYSYIDSKRKFKYYPEQVTPEFVSVHNVSSVVKYWIAKLNTQASITYNYTSGRPYNNPNKADFMSEKTKSFHNLSCNLSYITNLFGYFTVVHLSVNNVPGLNNIYTYRYSETTDNDGFYKAIPVKSMMQRSIILGVFISIK
jgi:hypothetical protein